MHASKRTKLFNRIFLCATLLWVLYLAVFVPVRRHILDEAADSSALANCLQKASPQTGEPDAGCMVSAEGERVIHQTEWRTFYGPGWWLVLLIACAGFPLIAYVSIHASITFLSKIRRLRKGFPPNDQYA